MAGKLYLCATPIGNLEDITLRVLRILKEVDLIAAEDTRNSIKLLNYYEIKKPMTSYHEFNKIEKAYQLAEKLRDGKNIALITDAGTPGISDPGEELVKICCEEGIEVISLPGASACITGLTVSGLHTRRFSFEAFLPRDNKKRSIIMEELKEETRTIIIYEAPHHLLKTLEELFHVLGDRQITVCRELTKKHEEIIRSSIGSVLEIFRKKEPRGEFVLIIEGKSYKDIEKEKKEEWMLMDFEDHMRHYEMKGVSHKEAMKMVARDRGITKRDVYQELLRIQKQQFLE